MGHREMIKAMFEADPDESPAEYLSQRTPPPKY